MFRNYLVTVLRQVRKNKIFSLINIIGLAVGISACLIISEFVFFHTSFDNYHVEKDRIFRIHNTTTKGGVDQGESGQVPSMMGVTLQEESPLVEKSGRFWSLNYMNNAITYKDEDRVITLDEAQVYGSDRNVFDILNFKVLSGDLQNFHLPQKAVLSRSTALKYFNTLEESIGKTFTLSGNNGEQDYEVVATMEDIPENSHLDIGVLVSIESIEKYTRTLKNWTAHDYFTYLLLTDPTQIEDVEAHMMRLYDEHAKERLEGYGYEMSYFLKPIEKIHTHFSGTDFNSGFKSGISYDLVIGLGIIAVIILVIAWINYLNLTLVKTTERLKEVGIRKALGSNQNQITSLFLTEAFFLNGISFLVALTLTQILSGVIMQLTGFTFNLIDSLDLVFYLFILVLVGAFLVGFYPTLLMKTIRIQNALLGKKAGSSGKTSFRSILVSIQFIITFLLIAVTIGVYKQIDFMKSADLGFTMGNILVIKAPPGDVSDQEREDLLSFNVFKTEILKNSGVAEVTNGGELPGARINWIANLQRQGKSSKESIAVNLLSMGREYIDFFGMEIIAGRNLREGDDPWSTGEVLINEKLVELLGFEDPQEAIGTKLDGFFTQQPLVITGIVANHHQTSLHDDFMPIAYILSSWTEYYFTKFDVPENLNGIERYEWFQSIHQKVETEWHAAFGDIAFDSYYLDQFFNRQYASDEQFGKIFTSFAILAIIIASLGLFGLTSYNLQQRTKEIGIRKVLGAGTQDLIFLLSRGFILTIILAYALSMPVAWILISNWLEGYSFRIDLGAWLLYFPLLIVLSISGITIILRILRTIRLNPVDSLRYE